MINIEKILIVILHDDLYWSILMATEISDILDNVLSIFKKKYEHIRNVYIELVSTPQDNCAGKCVMDLVGDFKYIGKMRSKDVRVDYIQIHNDPTYKIDDLIMTLLHEISHAITPYIERKVKNDWIIMDHSHKFYENFLLILDIAYQNKIITKKYDLRSLKNYDGKQAHHAD